MAFIPASAVAEIEMRASLYTERVENTLYFKKDTGSIDQTALDALTNFMDEEWNTAWKPILQAQYTFREVYGTDLTSATSFVSTNVDHAGVTGSAEGVASPGSVAFCVSFRTGNRGRSGRGRNYWTSVPTSQITGNFLSPTYRNLILAVYNRLILTPPSGWTWGVLSRFHSGAARVAGLFQPITTVVAVDDALDSQRRRLAGRGT
jgi:hypothetical protein